MAGVADQKTTWLRVHALARREIHPDACVEVDRKCPDAEDRDGFNRNLVDLTRRRRELLDQQGSIVEVLDRLTEASRAFVMTHNAETLKAIARAIVAADEHQARAATLDRLLADIKSTAAQLDRRTYSVIIPHSRERFVSIASNSLEEIETRIHLGDFKQ